MEVLELKTPSSSIYPSLRRTELIAYQLSECYLTSNSQFSVQENRVIIAIQRIIEDKGLNEDSIVKGLNTALSTKPALISVLPLPPTPHHFVSFMLLM